MTDIEGEITLCTILHQCELMNINEKLDAFFLYSGHVNVLNVYVNYNADYSGRKKHNTIYKVQYSGNGLSNKKSLSEIYQELIGIEFEYCEKQTALDEERIVS